jgi:hypothetical protein
MKQIKDYTDYYITEDGRIFKNDKELRPSITNKGYKTYRSYIKGIRKHISIHRAVAELYVENVNNKPQVNHIDGNKLNNHYTNLEWVTNQENRNHAITNGLHIKGEESPNSKFKEEDIKFMRENYGKFSYSELAKQFNTNSSRIWKIVNYKTWKHI